MQFRSCAGESAAAALEAVERLRRRRDRIAGAVHIPNRQVRRLANYGLKDGKIFDFVSRTTPTSGQEMSYLTPLFKLLSFN